MKFNFRKLSHLIIDTFGTQYLFAEEMGLTERSVSLKINGKRQWKQEEIMKACHLLGITVDEIGEIFFNVEV